MRRVLARAPTGAALPCFMHARATHYFACTRPCPQACRTSSGTKRSTSGWTAASRGGRGSSQSCGTGRGLPGGHSTSGTTSASATSSAPRSATTPASRTRCILAACTTSASRRGTAPSKSSWRHCTCTPRAPRGTGSCGGTTRSRARTAACRSPTGRGRQCRGTTPHTTSSSWQTG